MKSYIGRRRHDGTLSVTVKNGDGQERDLDPRFDLRRHSPSGYEVGYAGSGPAQLSLAILADLVGEDRARSAYQWFKVACIANLPRDENWVLSETEILGVLKNRPGEEV